MPSKQKPTEYQRLVAEGKIRRHKKGSPRGLSDEVKKARREEQTRRYVESQRRAQKVLAMRYADEYDELLEQETEGVNVEKGPLPGDP